MQKIIYNNIDLAYILRSDFKKSGIHFFSPPEFSQQLGYMNRDTGYCIAPHDHNPVTRTIMWTQEVLFIKSGKVRIDLYAPQTREYIESYILNMGDVILLAHGGHGFEILENAEIIEVKQGPYSGEADKTRFEPVTQDKLNIK
jgi:hypothetical protein